MLIVGAMTIKRSAVILLGPPAGGKTTVANTVDEADGVAIIRTGHLLRSAVTTETESGRELKRHLEAGHLAPTKLVVQVIGAAIDEQEEDVLIFDGFPRLEDQIAPCFAMLAEREVRLGGVLVLTLSDQEIQRRLSGRRACPSCGASYHIDAQPPREDNRCDQCGSELVQRADDAPDAIAKRLVVYGRETLPVVNYFKSQYSHLTEEISVESSTDAACQALREIIQRARRGGGHAGRKPR